MEDENPQLMKGPKLGDMQMNKFKKDLIEFVTGQKIQSKQKKKE